MAYNNTHKTGNKTQKKVEDDGMGRDVYNLQRVLITSVFEILFKYSKICIIL